MGDTCDKKTILTQTRMQQSISQEYILIIYGKLYLVIQIAVLVY